MRSIAFYLLFLATCGNQLSWAQSSVVPVSYTTAKAVYAQNFDGLPSTGSFALTGKGPINFSGTPINAAGLAGWQLMMIAGSNTNASFGISTGSSTGSGVYSLGSTGSSERALGSLASGTAIYAIGVVLTNNTGSLLNRATVSFTAEQWRKGGSTNKNTWHCRYKTGTLQHIDQTGLLDVVPLNFSSVINTSPGGSLNGNLPENQQNISFTINNIDWKPGEQLLLRWDDADEAGSDDICGIDNFRFSATLASTVPAAVTNAATDITSNSAVLNGSVNDNNATTSIAFEYDSLDSFLHPSTIHAVPDTIIATRGNTNVSATLTSLLPGTKYYYRMKATNQNGSTTGDTLNFTTGINLATVITSNAFSITKNTAWLSGEVSKDGGAPVTERGIVWSANPHPVLSDTKIIVGSGTGGFSKLITGLPEGTTVYTRAYAITAGGTAYGDDIVFTTLTGIVSLKAIAPGKTNLQAVTFRLETTKSITGLSASNFILQTPNISNAEITNIAGSENAYSITVNTGTGDGLIGLIFANTSGLSPKVDSLPFTSTDSYIIDKTPPQIKTVSIPDSALKIGDTMNITISVMPDKDTFRIISANMNGMVLSGLSKKNDSTYTSQCVIPNGGTDVDASADIPVTITLADSIGNLSHLYQLPIHQSSDGIDANRPFIRSLRIPPDNYYKTGDTLDFIFHFNEKTKLINTDSKPSFPLTIGIKTRSALYAGGSGSDSMIFRYIIQSGELDKNGIKIGNAIDLNNCMIEDLAGNVAALSFSNTTNTKNILVDAVAPSVSKVLVPVASVYKTGNILDFIVNYTKKIIITSSAEQPYLQLTIGSKTRKAMYQSGSGSNALLFRYMIASDDSDRNGIKISSGINLNNATITDELGNHASLTLNNIGSMSGIVINPVTAAVNKVIVPENGIYKSGDTLEFIVDYNEKVLVTTANGIPSVKLTIGKSTKQAFYRNGSGSNELLFMYVIQPGDEDTDGIKLNANISLNNGAITDAMNNPAPVLLNNTESTKLILIDAVAPVITGMIIPDNRTYKISDTLDFSFRFSKKVIVTQTSDTPAIKLTIGTITKNMFYISGTDTDSLLFRYVVQQGDLDKNGIRLGSSILLNNCTITDSIGNNASLTIKNSGLQAGIRIDGIAPFFVTKNAETISVCENSSALPINNTLSATDDEEKELINWKIIRNDYHGNLNVLSYTTASNGKTLNPEGFIYYPLKDHHSTDTILVQLSDGNNTSEKILLIKLLPAIRNNIIGSPQTICTNSAPASFSGTSPSGGDGIYSYIWETAGINDTSGFSKAQGINNRQDYLSGPLSTSTFLRRKIVSNVCTDTSSAILITVQKNGLWLGNTDNNWNNAKNWCNNIIPDSTTDVMVFQNSNRDPLITDTAWCHQITLFDKTSLTITGVLEINGNIMNSYGSIIADKGTIICAGNTQQSISGSSFPDHKLKNLVVNNPSGVSLSDPLILTGTLLLNSGFLHTNNQLRLQNKAVIGPSAAGTYIKGNVSIEHQIKGGRRCFWLLGHPFSNDTGLQMLKDSLDITGDGGSANGFTNSATNQPSAFRHNPDYGNDSLGIDAGWIPFTHTNGSNDNTWKKHSGIRLLMRGKPGQGLDGTPAGNGKNGTYLPQPVMLNVSGEVQTGDQEIRVRKDKYAGYNVIANPYASPVDLSLSTRAGNIGTNFWIWNPMQGTNGGYSSVPFGNKYILPPFGSFIVKANGNTNNTILFTENSKTSEAAPDSLPVIDMDDAYHIELRLETDTIFWDRIILLAIDSAGTGFDKIDAEKFQNNEVNFYSLSKEQKQLSIDARPVNNESIIRLGIQTNITGTFAIRIAKAMLPSSNKLMLHDRYLDKWMHLETDSAYSFNINTDSMSKGNKRFEITGPKKIIDPVLPASGILMNLSPVPAKDKIIVQFNCAEAGNTNIRILNLSGMPVKSWSLGVQKDGQVTIPVGELIRGIYLLELNCGKLRSTRKLIKD